MRSDKAFLDRMENSRLQDSGSEDFRRDGSESEDSIFKDTRGDPINGFLSLFLLDLWRIAVRG